MYSANQSAPSFTWKAVTASDATSLAPGCRGIFVGTGGDIAMTDDSGNTVTFSNVANGQFLPCGPTKVMATNTTATGIVALY